MKKQIKNKKLRIIPLGGVEEVGKNCMVIEYNNDIIVIDFGIDFPGPNLLGVDYLLPDVKYLQRNQEKIKGIVITHGHLDHIGALSYSLQKIGNPPIFATTLTMGFIKDRLREQGIKEKELNLNIIGFGIETPVGRLIHTGDFKIDKNPVDQKPLEKEKLRKWAKEGILALMSDSTNSTLPGHSVSEKEVGGIIYQIIKQTNGRIIFTTFSTLISRIQQVVQACQKTGRKIFLIGMSMQKSVAIARDLGYLTAPANIFIDPKELPNYPDKKVLVLAAGAQGVEGSSMDRISDNEHWFVRVKRGDTVVFSSSAIPGNELAIHQMMDGFVNQGAKIIYRAVLGSGVHSSGHAFQQEQQEMINLTKPKFFIPIEGQHYMQAVHIDTAVRLGIPRQNCFMLYNGQILEIEKNKKAKILKEKIPLSLISVESNKINVLDENILKKRKKMAESGVCLVCCHKQGKNDKIDIVIQGLFIEKNLIKELEQKIKKLLNKYKKKSNTKVKIQNSLGDFILNKTGKKPLVILIIN